MYENYFEIAEEVGKFVIGDPCHAGCFASVFFKQTVEFKRPPCSTVCFKKTKAKQLARQGFCPPI